MPTLPNNPPPSSVEYSFNVPSSRADSLDETRAQTKVKGTFKHEFKLRYTDPDLEQRRDLEAFFLESGTTSADAFDAVIPTYTDNSNMTNSTVLASGSHSVGSNSIVVDGLGSDAFVRMNFIRVSGSNRTYVITSVGPVSAGQQTLQIKPSLKEPISDNATILCKDVPIRVIRDGKFTSSSRGVSASVSIKLIEEPVL